MTYLISLPPLSAGGCHDSLALSLVTSLTSRGPPGLAGGPVKYWKRVDIIEKNISIVKYMLKIKNDFRLSIQCDAAFYTHTILNKAKSAPPF